MNITEANDVQTLLTWILDDDADVPEHNAMHAAERLANRAHRRLGAGTTGGRVLQEWTKRRPYVIHDCPDGAPLRVVLDDETGGGHV